MQIKSSLFILEIMSVYKLKLFKVYVYVYICILLYIYCRLGVNRMIANNQYQLTMSQFCKEKILDHDPRSLKSNHQQI